MAEVPSIYRRVALVTGASRGIGRAIALELGRLGLGIVVNFVRNEAAARETASAVNHAGGQSLLCRADIARTEDRRELVAETLVHFGRIDVLVNNAGVAVSERGDLLDGSEESWDQIISTNLRGPYFLTQLVAREMLRLQEARIIRDPKIVNISSVSAYAASTNRGEYCIAKAGMAMMTRLFASRLAENGIQVFEIRPGIVETDMTLPVHAQYDKLISEGLTPVRRWGQPGDVAKAVAAIVHGFFPFSTGEVINVDGGFHVRRL
jgi:NAD(P)-dependent dehydrogenase (short-subunit alcohol dehydrogenase family)